MNSLDTAFLSNDGRYTLFSVGDSTLRFIAPYSLERYLDVVEWDNGYLVVNAKYTHSPNPIEEYIDLVPILDNLFIDKTTFLSPIKKVEVIND